MAEENRYPSGETSVHPEVRRSEDIYAAYRSSGADWMNNAVTGDRFYNGTQWLDKDVDILKARNEYPHTQNETKRIINGKIARLAANNPQFQTSRREDSDQGISRLFDKLLSYIWDRSEGRTQFKRVLHHRSHRGGRGVLFSWYDPRADFGKGEIYLKAIEDALWVHVDPNSRHPFWNDAANIITRRPMTRYQGKMMWPDKAGIIDRALPDADHDGPSDSYSRLDRDDSGYKPALEGDIQDEHHDQFTVLERYTKIKRRFLHVFHEGEEAVFNEDDYDAWLQGDAYIVDDGDEVKLAILGQAHEETEALYRQFGGEGDAIMFHARPVVTPEGEMDLELVPGPEDADGAPDSTVIVSPVKRLALTEEFITTPHEQPRIKYVCSFGRQLLFNTVLPYTRYPLTPFYNTFNGNPYPVDDVDDLKDIQRGINFRKTRLMRHLANASGRTIIVPNGFFNNDPTAEDKIGAPGTNVVYGDFEQGQPFIIDQQQLANEEYVAIENDRAAMERIAGFYEFQQGGGQQPETYRGTLAQDEFAQRRIRNDLTEIEAALAWHGALVVEMIQKHYTQEKVIRIVNPQTKEPEEYVINQIEYDSFGKEVRRLNDVTVGSYDVRVIAGSTLESSQIAKSERHERLATAGLIDREEFLKHSEDIDGPGVIRRMGVIAQLQQAVEQLEEENKRLRGDMQTADRELRNADRRVASEKYKGSLSRSEAKVAAASEVAIARMGDAAKKTKEE